MFPSDPLDVPFRRVLNIARQIIAEGVAYDEEARDAFHEAMQWPEVVEVEERNVMDQSARHAAQLLGSDNVDAMVLRTWEARQRAQAEKAAERERAEHPDYAAIREMQAELGMANPEDVGEIEPPTVESGPE